MIITYHAYAADASWQGRSAVEGDAMYPGRKDVVDVDRKKGEKQNIRERTRATNDLKESLTSRIRRESRRSTKSRPQQVQQKSSADVTDRQRPPTHRERHRRSIAVDTPR